jgi:penicillin-binding protein 1C
MPGDGDEYLIEPAIPLGAQTIPLRAVPAAGVRRLEVCLDDGEVILLGPPFATRIQARRGSHRVELRVPGTAQPAAVAEYVVY